MSVPNKRKLSRTLDEIHLEKPSFAIRADRDDPLVELWLRSQTMSLENG